MASFPSDAADATGVLEAADVALYRAKQSGRNRVEISTEAGPRAVAARAG